ncbi:ABC transporter permease [Pontibacillus salipaludis]|uniref:Transport permease protein n=1 Tax=Pontibacillus salipaludis TaxID=1697394 RepID=A0ABQ1QGH6_9BACI|nr:ABC transporter permease [Pontibacillus salipaludis]GGD26346.1 transport permease protein [Pontibacillus salipaludis]
MNVQAITVRIIRQFKRDKRSLALMLLAPLLVLTLMWLVLDGDRYEPTLAFVNVPEQMTELFKEQDVTIKKMGPTEAETALEEMKVDALIHLNQSDVNITLEGSDPSTNQAVMGAVQKAMQNAVPAQSMPFNPNFSYLHGSDELGLFDNVGPVLIGFFVFFFVFIIGGVSFLRERTQGTLERILSTPLKRWEIVTGYVSGFGLFTILQTALIAFFAIYALDVWMAGSIWYVLLISILLALTALTLGTLLSAFANNEFQMIQFIPLVIVPQVFFSGLFNLDAVASWIKMIGQIMPLTYGANALRGVMIRGEGFADIQMDVYVLLGFAASFFILNIVALKKHRKL